MNEQQLNTIAHKFGMSLLDAGIKMVRSAYKDFKPTKVPFSTLNGYLSVLGINPGTNQLDADYFITSWNKWQFINETTTIDRITYITDQFDCDNYAFLYSSLSSLLFGLTSPVVYGAIYDNQNGKLINYHYFNLIMCDNGDVYVYEPMKNMSVQLKKLMPIIIDGWQYKILKINFF